MNKKRVMFVTVYRPIAGWKAVMYWWNDTGDLGPGGYWEPWNTGLSAFATEEAAEHDAQVWAETEGVPYVPRGGSPPGWNPGERPGPRIPPGNDPYWQTQK